MVNENPLLADYFIFYMDPLSSCNIALMSFVGRLHNHTLHILIEITELC